MGNGWHEWPLVLFTVLGQCVAGALIVSGYGWLTAKDEVAKQRFSVAGNGHRLSRLGNAPGFATARL